MTFRLVPNFEPTSDGHAIWKMKEELVAEGWVIRSSGTGTGAVYSAAGDAHAPGGVYAGTLDLATSWFCIRQPVAASPRREYVFFRPNTTHGVWRIYYSSDGTGFTGGAPSATVAPTATDAPGAASVVGALFNGNGGTTNLFGSAGARSYRCDYIIGDTTEGFSFLMQVRKIGYNAVYAMVGLDVLQNANGLDIDPAIAVVGGPHSSDAEKGLAIETAALFQNTDSQTAGGPHGWYVKGGGAPAWVLYPMPGFGFQNGSSTYEPVGNNNPPSVDVTGRLPSLPMLYSRGGSAHATQRGHKGRSRLFKYEMNRSYGRPYPDRSRWIMGAWSVPWDGVTTMMI